jgi:site-specific DNA-cytosine methylase
VTVRDVLKDLESIEPDEEGGNGMVVLPDGAMTYDHVAGNILKAGSETLDADKPSKTVRRNNGIEHYSLGRNITVREMARLQSFPDDYEFCGSTTQKKSQIGNAVPVNLAVAVAKSIGASLL